MSEISKNNKEIGKTIATKVPINIHNQLMNLIENGDYLSIYLLNFKIIKISAFNIYNNTYDNTI